MPRLGPKAFEQCSGFLRIRDGKQPLDASAVHPEAYAVVERMAKDTGTTVRELMQSPERRKAIRLSEAMSPDKLGLPTLTDIMKELEKPGRDPRGPFKPFSFAEGVSSMQDLKQGMKLPGIVTNVTAFGAFVDIGVHQDGLVHISQLANRFVRASQRSRQSASGSARHRARRGHPPQAHFLDDARRIGKKAGKRRGSGMLSLCVMNPKERNSPDSSAHVPKKFLRDRSGRA